MRGVANARGLALTFTSVYVAVTGAILAVGHHPALAVVHALLLCALVWATGSEQRVARLVGDVGPLLLMPALYAELPQLIAVIGNGYHDLLIQHLELRVFGEHPSRTFAGRFPITALSEVLHAGYLTYYPAVFVPAAWLYAKRERRGFAQLVLGVAATYAVCWAIFICFPVEGPRYEWVAPAGVPDGAVRRLALAILTGGSSRGAAFPSSHMAISVVQTVVMWRWSRGAALVLAVLATLVGLGAVYGGFHYGIDIVAGGLLGALIGFLVRRSMRTAQVLVLP
ncbi:MAG TPA: phosphatase PAP2 family protein [Gemmatimonadaceae bacterium]